MAPPRWPGRPTTPPRGLVPGRTDNPRPDPSDWFPVELRAVLDDPTADGKSRYTGVEVWNRPGGNTVEAVGKRVLTEAQPGVFLGDDPGYTADDLPVLALARLGPGAGGRVWELKPFDSSGGGISSAVACRGAFAGWGTTTCARFRIPAAGTGGCANVAATAGLYVTGGWDADAGGWVMDATVTTAAGATTFTLYRDTDGDPSLVASWDDPDGAGSGAAGSRVGTFVGCVGGWMEFAFGGSDLCSGTGATDCDNVFRVRVTCDDCFERDYVRVVCQPAETFVRRTLYATFGGALAELGTVVLPYTGGSGSIMEFQKSDGVSSGDPAAPSCYDYPGNGWNTMLRLCFVGDADNFTLTVATSLSRCSFSTGILTGAAVTSFDPFYAEYTGTVEDSGEGAPPGGSYFCLCDGAAATVVITDTPP